MEVTLMDKRISELRERLYKKKAEARQKENLPVRLGALNISCLHIFGGGKVLKVLLFCFFPLYLSVRHQLIHCRVFCCFFLFKMKHLNAVFKVFIDTQRNVFICLLRGAVKPLE